jgi:hypothetical protein
LHRADLGCGLGPSARDSERPHGWGHVGGVQSGRHAGALGTARIWRAFPTTQALIDYAKSIVPRQLIAAQRKQFFLE